MAGSTVYIPADIIGPYLTSNGTAAAPSFSFITDTDTGIYHIASDSVGISCGGVLRLTVNTTGVTAVGRVMVPDGAAATPGLRVTSEASGMYLSSANLLGFAVAGAAQASLDNTGILAAASGFRAAAGGAFAFGTNSQIQCSADGLLTLLNNAGTGFTRLCYGGTTASFPALKRNGTAINFRLADDSADCGITAGASTFSGVITGTAGDATAPGLALGAAGDGVFRVGAGVMGLTGTGVEVARFSATLAQVPAASVLTWLGRATLQSAGATQVTLNGGGVATTLSTGFVFGTSASVVYDSGIGGFRAMNANQSANTGWAGQYFNVTNSNNVNFGTNLTTGTQSGMGFSGTAPCNVVLTTNNTAAITIEGAAQVVTLSAALRVANLAADPTGTSAVKGAIYLNTGTNKLKFYNGTAWETVTSA